MTSDLFPDCKQDSPRLAWMKRHGVTVRQMTEHDRMFVADDGSLNYVAEMGHETAYGKTEEDALAALGIPLWNEELYMIGTQETLMPKKAADALSASSIENINGKEAE